MRKLIDDNTKGIDRFMGERITLFCCRFYYTGKLIAIDDHDLELEDCGIVYETGELDDAEWKDYKKLPNNWFVARQSVESYGILK
jgi:hypothetical protein